MGLVEACSDVQRAVVSAGASIDQYICQQCTLPLQLTSCFMYC